MDSLNKYRVELVRKMDTAAMYADLRVGHLLTADMQDELECVKTSMSRNGRLLDMLARRGPTAKQRLIDALRNTHQTHLVNLILYGTEVAAEKELYQVPKKFDSLIVSVSQLKPCEKTVERSGTVLITSVKMYSELLPKSDLSVREIPHVLAVASGMYGKDAILALPDAPSKHEFERQMSVYESETTELQMLLHSLEDGGIHFVLRPRDDRIIAFFTRNVQKPYIYMCTDGIHLIIQRIQCLHFSQNDLKLICCVVHLMCFGDVEFLIRKTVEPRPNSYLLFKSEKLAGSIIAMDRDRQWILDAAKTDESVSIPETRLNVSPW
jgi:Caspase recruitment domain